MIPSLVSLLSQTVHPVHLQRGKPNLPLPPAPPLPSPCPEWALAAPGRPPTRRGDPLVGVGRSPRRSAQDSQSRLWTRLSPGPLPMPSAGVASAPHPHVTDLSELSQTPKFCIQPQSSQTKLPRPRCRSRRWPECSAPLLLLQPRGSPGRPGPSGLLARRSPTLVGFAGSGCLHLPGTLFLLTRIPVSEETPNSSFRL